MPRPDPFDPACVVSFGHGYLPAARRSAKVSFIDRRPATPPARQTVAGAVANLRRFASEDVETPRQQLIAALEAAGVDVSALTDAVPDAFLEAILAALQQQNAQQPDQQTPEQRPVQPVPAQQFSDRTAAGRTIDTPDARGFSRRAKMLSGSLTGKAVLRNRGDQVDPRSK
jgi:hypothetical protein